MAVCAVLAGAGTFAAITDWADDLDEVAGHRLGFTGRIPVLSTLWRLLVRIDDQALQTVLTDWLRSRVPAAQPQHRRARRVVAIDGKVLRGARLPGGGQVHLLSAYDTATGVVLAQVRVSAKSKKTGCTGSATSPSAKTHTKPAPATAPPSPPSYATPPSDTTAATAKPTSPEPPDAPTAAPTTSSTP